MSPSQHIDQLIAKITDWRGKTFASVRKSILGADREIIEEWKWMGSPVWYRDGMIAVANAHKGKVKLTFLYGAKLADPDKLFNAGLEGNARRAIEFLDFPGHRHREFVDEFDIARDLVVGDLAVAEGADLVGGQRFAGPGPDPGAELLAIAVVGDAEDLHVLDLGVAIEELLDLARI